MSATFVEPKYASLALSDLMPSVAANLLGKQPTLRLPAAGRYVVLLVDGLGWHQLSQYQEHAETMTAALDRATKLTCGVPSTTATSLTSLGCGAPPGEHGVLGYSFFDAAAGGVLNALTWENGPADIADFAQCPTQFRVLKELGIESAAVTLERFGGSALTQLAFSDTTHFPVRHEGEAESFTDLVLEALGQAQVVYAYERMLDHDGHGFGVGSWQWLDRLAQVDDLVAHLETALPSDVALLVTGDHGMVNVPPNDRIVVEEEAGLGGYRWLGGEPRFRHVYGDDAAALARSWEQTLGERALVLRRAEAIEAGWFGAEVTERSSQRIGDVVAAMRGEFALMSIGSPGEFSLIGMHGSLTAAEMEVPLLTFGGQH